MGTEAAEAAEATLELTFLSIDIHSSHAFLAKQKPTISAWLDPAHKRSTRPHNSVLHLPLSLRAWQNPSSALTVQILSPRFFFKPSRPSASASALLSSLPLYGDPFTLHLRRPSGGATGYVRLCVRVLWSPDLVSSLEAEAGLRLEPSAPPLPEPEIAPDEKMREENTAWRNFLFGALSGAVAVVLVNFIRRQ